MHEAGARAMLVATAGGHLTQLNALAPRLGIDPDTALWVSVPTEQSRSLLSGRDVVWADYSTPRDLRALATHLGLARRVTAEERFSVAISTGASLAPPFLAAARARGVACHFIESATRVQGPSFTGRLVRRIPGIRLYSQYESWSEGPWHYGGSIFDGWEPRRRNGNPELRRVLVSVGSARGFPFDRMVRAVNKVLPASCEITWQILDADPTGLTGRVVEELPAAELRDELAQADAVVSHAGTGSVVSALELGLCPVIVPRQAVHHEHIDDHQSELASMLATRGLAVVRSPDELTLADVEDAAARSASSVEGPPFRLIA